MTPLDADLCPSKPTSATLILVDQTSTFTAAQIQTVRQVILAARTETPAGGRLSLLYLVADAPYEPSLIFAKCNPGSGRDANIWLTDPAKVQRQWEAQFQAPLDEALRLLEKPTSSPTSPIMENIRSVGWRSDFRKPQPRRKLVIISDMVQNSPMLSMYARDELASDKLTRDEAARTFPDLTDVLVNVRILRSSDTIAYQGEDFERSWRKYFESAGATLEWER